MLFCALGLGFLGWAITWQIPAMLLFTGFVAVPYLIFIFMIEIDAMIVGTYRAIKAWYTKKYKVGESK